VTSACRSGFEVECRQRESVESGRIGRLKRGVSFEQATAEIRVFQWHLDKVIPWPMPQTCNAGLSVVPLSQMLTATCAAVCGFCSKRFCGPPNYFRERYQSHARAPRFEKRESRWVPLWAQADRE
jgi:hypothetical protein